MGNDQKIGIIGVGHIGHALISGFLRNKKLHPGNFLLSDPNQHNLSYFQKKYNMDVSHDNMYIAQHANIILIAVRPKVVANVIDQIKDFIQEHTLIVSVAACVTIVMLEKLCKGEKRKIIRMMPNIPISYGKGVVGWIANRYVTGKDKKRLQEIFSSLGFVTECLREESLDSLSLLSGCGPGYVAYIMSELEMCAKAYGFTPSIAKEIILQTLSGTIEQISSSGMSFEELTNAVATKGGITEEIIRSLKERSCGKILEGSFKNGYAKMKAVTKEIQKELS